MPPLAVNAMPVTKDKSDVSDYATATDAESSDAATDESWVKTPAKKKGEHFLRTPTSRGGSNSRRFHDTPKTTLSKATSLTTPSQSGKPYGKQLDRTPQSGDHGLRRSQTQPVISTSTPTGRKIAVQNALQNISTKSPSTSSVPSTPSRARTAPEPQKYRVVIVSSDEENDSEVEASFPPTRPGSIYEDPIPSNSNSSQSSMDSQSSMNSIFSKFSIASSVSDIASPVDDCASSVSSFVTATGPRYNRGRHAENTTASPQAVRPERKDVPRRAESPSPAVVRNIPHPNRSTASPNVTNPKPQRLDPNPVAPAQLQTEVPATILQFANSPFGTELGVAVIAHDDRVQRLLDDNRIEWGVQYELARGVSAGNWTWDAVIPYIPALTGKNASAAYKVVQQMRHKEAMSPSDRFLWLQLDREQAAIKENLGRGLGLMGDFEGASDWYGGRIQQLGRLVKEEGGNYKIKLERMESRRSHRFARYLGSRRFLQVRVPEELFRQDHVSIKKFLKQKFVLCGRVFVPFHSKENSIYLVETNEDYGRTTQEWCGDPFRCSFNEFINWHNPLTEMRNCKQVISKYATRFALGLSNSTPAVEFDEENIHFIDDITAEGWPEGKKAPADKLMTDGCGFINHAALLLIVKKNGYESLPAGIQGRIDGSKGFFILHPTDNANVPKIWIRDSQNKIKNRSFDRAHRILDLVAASQPSVSSALTQQSIINLHANGIPAEKLTEMMEQGLEGEIMPLLDWDKPRAMTFLGAAISKAGGVPGARTQRVAYSLNRVLGFKGRDWHDDDLGDDEDDNDDEPVEYTGRNAYTGAPLALHEVALELIQSGFHPAQNYLLQEKIQYIVKNVIKASVEKYRIPVAQSFGAFIVPDPLGVLEEGQVYYRYSKPRPDPNTGILTYVVEGEILLGRYPIRLPSDIQKVTAVDRRELEKWPDVLIVSTKGNRSIASLLADGDMDGDEIIGIVDPELVQAFDSKPFTNPPDNFLEQNFERDVRSVEEFCAHAATLPSRQANELFQGVLISNLSESRVGLYSSMHETSILMYGYNHQETIRLAYIFATLLDSSKSGQNLKYGIFQRDSKKFKRWGNNFSASTTNTSADILATLKAAGEKKGDELLAKYDALKAAGGSQPDPDLVKPYNAVNDSAMAYFQRGFKHHTDEMKSLRDHVVAAQNLYNEAWSKYFAKKDVESEYSTKKSSKSSRKEKREDVLLECSRKFAEPMQFAIKPMFDEDIIKASFAYGRNPKFGFGVAFTTLCHIKAKACGIAPIIRDFDEAKTFSSSYMRALTHAEEDRRNLS